MRSITDVFIKHPVLAVVVNFAIVLIGLRAMVLLPIQQYPKLESTSVVITTYYIGASAETIRGFLTTPIEQAVSSIAGVDYIESSSTAGASALELVYVSPMCRSLGSSRPTAMTELHGSAYLAALARDRPTKVAP